MRASHLSFVLSSTVFLAVMLGGGGCSTNAPAFDGIANRGVVPVSAQSPFMGSNIFLAHEMEESLYLYNFIQSRSAPQAIEVRGDAEMDSELLLFYAHEREYYSAVPRNDPQSRTKEWIIRGPYPLTREQYPHVAHLTGDQGGVFEIFGKQERFGGPGKAIESRVIQPAFIPTPQPTPKPVKKKTNPSVKQQEAPGPGIEVQGTPINLDQQALFESRRTPAVDTPKQQQAPQATSIPARPTIDDALSNSVNKQPPSVKPGPASPH
jgi:hypothetical protein